MERTAHDYALRLLEARAYSTRDLRRKLAEREFDAEEIESAIERLTASGLVDDRKYAAEFARQRLVHGASSARRVQQQLRQRGIDSATIRSAVDEVAADEGVDPRATIDRLVKKKLSSLDGLEREVKRRRLFGFLARQGFEIDDIKRAIALHFP